MKNKIISNAIFLILFYILPLMWKTELIFSVPFNIVFIACAVLLFTQPTFTISESKENKSNDKLSVLLIMGTVAFTQIFLMFEWGYLNSNFHTFSIDLYSIIGITLLIGGGIFRILSIQKLGKHFTATVRTQDDQKIIKTGAYQYLRHPSYLGAYLAVIGTTVLLHANISIFIAIVGMFLTYVYRIRVEEKTLVNEFGSEYENYQKETNRMIPFIY